jgi:hypothetical protein
VLCLLYVGYIHAASGAYSAAVDAHKRFDCSDAAEKYSQVISFYALALPSHRGIAKERRSECRDAMRAEGLAQDNDHKAAADLYATILDEHAASPILDELQIRRADELLSWGDDTMRDAATDPRLVADALRPYETVIAEPETPEDNAALTRIAKLWNSTIAADVCTRKDAMLALAAGKYVTDVARDIRDSAGDRAPRDMVGCAKHLIVRKRYGAAMPILRSVIRDYRGTPDATRAKASLIDAQVGQIRGGGTAKLPAPSILGYAGGGDSEILFKNSSPYTLEILLSGPSSRRFVVPRCAGCKKFSSSAEVTDCPSGPTRTFVVKPGVYSAVVRDTTRHVKAWAGDFRVDTGYRYDEGCFYIITSSPYRLPPLKLPGIP